MPRRIVYECSVCGEEIKKIVCFDATTISVKRNDVPTFCQKHAVEHFAKWIVEKLSNGCNILLVTGGLDKEKL